MKPRPEEKTNGAAEVVERAILEILPSLTRQDIARDKHLRELGADSVDRVEIILSIINQLALDEPMSSFGQIPDIGALIDFVSTKERR